MQPVELMKANEAASVVFGRSISGYNRDQVDDFLDRVADSLQAYAELLAEAQRRNAELEDQLSGSSAAAELEDLKRSLKEALSAPRPVSSPAPQSEQIVADARAKAQQIIGQSQEQAARLAEQVRVLTNRRDELLSDCRALVESFSRLLSEQSVSL
ncbi:MULTISPECIES: DivIVA domain-containing protein [Jonquetella]|uniref:DivIVA domain protein n=2 Tax=Jonquetella TaxID=428711 RepID=H0UKR8_9BACT|nr:MULTISPECIES: DivIVA domain-containing protein [Jonquetella]EEX48303.1 DivIVA domain protein [Jonquetella anthropi E3_33 E1]EHM13277.1 DivIVA domain protein [Jonquetella anthropi DSM 22815]ERL23608.1 DivIVA protein [Jonquetella sp. BV3C21]